MLHTYTADECCLSACRRVRGGLQQCARSADSPGGRGLLVLSVRTSKGTFARTCVHAHNDPQVISRKRPTAGDTRSQPETALTCGGSLPRCKLERLGARRSACGAAP